MSALASTMRMKGVEGTTVTDVVALARVSPEVFFLQFGSVRDCWRAGFEDLSERLREALAVVPETGPPLGQFNALLTNFLAALAHDADASKLHLTQLCAVDPHVLAGCVAVRDRLEECVVQVFDATAGPARFACEVLVAAISDLVLQALNDGDAEAILALRGPLVHYAEKALL